MKIGCFRGLLSRSGCFRGLRIADKQDYGAAPQRVVESSLGHSCGSCNGARFVVCRFPARVYNDAAKALPRVSDPAAAAGSAMKRLESLGQDLLLQPTNLKDTLLQTLPHGVPGTAPAEVLARGGPAAAAARAAAVAATAPGSTVNFAGS